MLKSIAYHDGSGDVVTTTFAYTNLAQRDKVLNERVGSPDPISEYAYTHDALGQRTGVVLTGEAFSGGTGDHNWEYQYLNDRGELTDADRRAGTTLGQGSSILPSGIFDYVYDYIGNRETFTLDNAQNPTSYTANDLNQYDAITHPDASSDTLVHDDDGNLIDDGVFKYTWDMENRLIAIEPKTPVENVSKRLEFTYDYMGRRIRKIVSTWKDTDPGGGVSLDWVEDSDGDHLFIYDQWNVLLVLDANDANFAIVHKYTWGLDLSGQSGNFTTAGIHGAGGVGGLLAVEEVSGTYAGDSYWGRKGAEKGTFYFMFDCSDYCGTVTCSSHRVSAGNH